jgi:hypothetical protein
MRKPHSKKRVALSIYFDLYFVDAHPHVIKITAKILQSFLH